MSVLGEFSDGVFARLCLRSLRMFWHVGFWELALVIGIASGVAPCCLGRLHAVDAMRAYDKALSDAAEEEHS